MEKYRTEALGNGLFKVHSVAIFAEGKRTLPNGETVEWTRKDLEEVAERFKKVKYRPPIFVGHADGETRTQGDRPALGVLANVRVATFSEGGAKKAGLIADFLNVSEDIVEALENDRYPGRSIEIGQKSRRVYGLALLGRTAAHYELPQHSLPEEHDVVQTFSFFQAEEYSMNPTPPAPAPAAPQAPAQQPMGQDPQQILQKIAQMLQPFLGGGAAPQAAPPQAAPAAPSAPASKFSADTAETETEQAPKGEAEDMSSDKDARIAELETELEFQTQLCEKYQARIAALESTSESASVEAETQKFEASVSKLVAEGYTVDKSSFGENVTKFGLDKAETLVRAGPRAPVKTAPVTTEGAVEVSELNQKSDDSEIPAKYGATSPEVQKRAQQGAAYWDADEAKAKIVYGTREACIDRFVNYPSLGGN